MVRGLNKEIGPVWAQTLRKPKSLHEQMALLRDIGHSLENFEVLNKKANDPKLKTQMGTKIRVMTIIEEEVKEEQSVVEDKLVPIPKISKSS